MKALIFAAGLGTRLRPITDTMPKALVPVGGVPMLERVIRRLASAGIDEFVVNAFHFKEKIVEFVGAGGLGVHVSVSVEDGAEPLETGGGIRHAAPLLTTDTGDGRFLVHNADILSNLDIRWLISQDRPSSLATLVVNRLEADRYLLFDDDMRLAGWTNVRTGEVRSPYSDFDPSKYHRYSFSGIHIISERMFGLMAEWPERFGIMDFYLSVAARQPIYGVLAEDLRLIDIGSPEKLAEAETAVESGLLE